MSSKGEYTDEVDPIYIRFMHSKIKPIFSDGKSVTQTLEDIEKGKVKLSDIPLIVVIRQDDTHYYSMNNRRLWVFKKLREKVQVPNSSLILILIQGLLKDNRIKVRVRPMPDTKRLKDKFSPERCSETAVFMKQISKEKEDVEDI
jgi:hypothetical protein